jgi:hypothetical protein
MLPWLFGVLLVLNLALFWLGQQYEVPIEPPLPPVPEAPYKIQLLSKGLGPGVPPASAAATAEAPAVDSPPRPGADPATDPVATGQSGQPGLRVEGDDVAPDEGASPDPSSTAEPIEPFAPSEASPEPVEPPPEFQ